MDRSVFVLVFDGFADWEPALALAWLRELTKTPVVTVGFSTDPVRSMAGMRVLPDRRFDDITANETRLLLLPGGSGWEAGACPEERVTRKIKELRAVGVPIAAICDATLAAARAGLLDDVAHTGNAPFFLSAIPGYQGAARYVDEPAVRDRGVITASGIASVEFAREILAELDVASPEKRAARAQVFRAGRVTPDVDMAMAFG